MDEVLDPASYILSGALDRGTASRSSPAYPTYQQIAIDSFWANSLEIRPANFNASFDPPHQGVGIPELVGRDGTWYTAYPGTRFDDPLNDSLPLNAPAPLNVSAPVFFTLSRDQNIEEAWALSTLVNLYLTNGLAYMSMATATLVMVEDLGSPEKSYIVPLSTYNDRKKATGTVQDLLSYLETPISDRRRKRDTDSHVGNWTKIDWQVYRYAMAGEATIRPYD